MGRVLILCAIVGVFVYFYHDGSELARDISAKARNFDMRSVKPF